MSAAAIISSLTRHDFGVDHAECTARRRHVSYRQMTAVHLNVWQILG
jgi:hypothetical protein